MKPKVAFFDFAGCEGCQLTVLNLEKELLGVLDHIDIVEFREAMTETSDEYDIAFVEGSITRESDIPRLSKIRETASVVVALGACAATGGINAMRNFTPIDEVKRIVYGDQADWYETAEVRPIDAV
ncbi:MAG: NADH:ubiquinone oxidoreductase, partial [Candidatus Latescibacterota bacterium]